MTAERTTASRRGWGWGNALESEWCFFFFPANIQQLKLQEEKHMGTGALKEQSIMALE